MAKSKHSTEIILLGKKIAEEFAHHGRTRMTLAWLSQYLAERIKNAEAERDPKKKKVMTDECVDLILKLWKHREQFPSDTQPLANFKKIIPVLQAIDIPDADIPSWERYRGLENATPWGKFVHKYRHGCDSILMFAIMGSITEDKIKQEKDWLKFPHLLSATEKEVIEGIDRLISKRTDYSLIQIIVSGREEAPKPEPKTKLDELLNKVQEILNDQQKAFDELKKMMLKETSNPDEEDYSEEL